MEFIDLSSQQERVKEKIDSNIQTVLKHGKYIMGPEVKELEQLLADYVGVKHGIACSSGTDAILLSLMSYGIGPGDAVFTVPFTFIATAEVISLLGATPVFVDIDPKTFNIDPEKLSLAVDAINKNDPSIYPLPKSPIPSRLQPKGIIPVDLFGLPADYSAINTIAKNNKLFVVEDAAQSFGAEYNSEKACALADIGCTSFFPAKPLGCYGDGGMCFTDNDEKAATMRSLLLHGKGTEKYDNIRVGINGRLDTLQAAILLAKFGVFPEEVEMRNQVARHYTDLIMNCNGFHTQFIPQTYKSVWAQYSMLAHNKDHRATLQFKLKNASIPTMIYYPKPLHMQTAFKSLGYTTGDFPVSEEYAERIFSLPMHPYITPDSQTIIKKTLMS